MKENVEFKNTFKAELISRSKWVFLPYCSTYLIALFYLEKTFVAKHHITSIIISLISFTILRSFIGFQYKHSTQTKKETLFHLHFICVVMMALSLGAFTFKCLNNLPYLSEQYFFALMLVFVTVASSAFSFAPWPQLRFLFSTLVLGSTILGLYVDSHAANKLTLISLTFVLYLFLEIQSRTYFREFQNLVRTHFEFKNEKAKLGDILDAAAGFVCFLDDQYNFVTLSKGFKTQMSLPESCESLPLDHALRLALVQFQNEGRQKSTLELELFSKWYMINFSAVTSPFDGYVLFGTPIDELISARKQVEEQRKRAMQTARLSAVGELAGGISHEINNPLSVIVMCVKNVQLMIRSENIDQEKINSVLVKITDTSLRISKIIQGLRQFARDSSGDPYIAISTNEIIEHTLDFVKEKFKNRGIKIKYLARPEIRIKGRQTDLSQALFNLIHNSVDAIEKLENRWIEIQVHSDSSFAYIHIIDSGPGLSKAVVDKLFVPFVTTKPVGANTGLGLSITKGILDQHQGDIYLDQSRAETCFVLKIPLADSPVQAAS